MVVMLGLFLACQTTSPLQLCDDECHGRRAIERVAGTPPLAIAELVQIQDPMLRDRVLLDIIELPNLHMSPPDAGALCDQAHTQPIRDLCQRRLSRPHLNSDRSAEADGRRPGPPPAEQQGGQPPPQR